MADREVNELAEELVGVLDYIKKDRKTQSLYDKVIEGNVLSLENINIFFEDFKKANSRAQQGAIVSGGSIGKILKSVSLLSRRVVFLEKENIRLQKKIKNIERLVNQLSEEINK